MSKVAFVHVTPDSLAPFSPGLCALEAGIRYPAGEKTFAIDHGPSYHPFFSEMGTAHFVVASAGSEVVGNVVGVRKEIEFAGRTVSALYICDLKVAASHRGRGLARRMLTFGLWRLVRTPELRRVRVLYGAAMKARAVTLPAARVARARSSSRDLGRVA